MAPRDKLISLGQSIIRVSLDFLKGLRDHDLGGLSAEFAFYFLLSLFPMLLFFAALIGHLANTPQTLDTIFSFMQTLFPPEITSLVQRDIGTWVASGSLTVFSASVLVYIWSSSRVFMVMLKGFNRIHDGEQKRSGIHIRVLSTLLVIISAFVLGIVFLVNLFGKQLSALVSQHMPSLARSAFFANMETLVTPAVLFLLAFSLYGLYPAGRRSIRALGLGAAFFTAVILISTILFRYYVEYSNIGSVYGALTAVIVSLLWMFFLGLIFFIGAEINASVLREVKPHA